MGFLGRFRSGYVTRLNFRNCEVIIMKSQTISIEEMIERELNTFDAGLIDKDGFIVRMRVLACR